MDRAFAALGDPVRRRILLLLTTGEQSVSALVEGLRPEIRISQPAVSQHLKVLREAGLVTQRAEGTRRLHAINPAGVEAARAWLAGLLDPAVVFAQPLDALETEVARGRRARRRAAESGIDGSEEQDKRLA